MSTFCSEKLGVVILSPHREDAAFSTGLLLWACALARMPAVAVNVFTRSEYAPYLDGSGLEAVSVAR